jgi:hypothetical protein
MRAVAKDAGMQDCAQGSGWIDTSASAWDEARFFSQLESLVPKAGRSLARRLLSGISAAGSSTDAPEGHPSVAGQSSG